jgi:phospholipid transport system substrate-binding protein
MNMNKILSTISLIVLMVVFFVPGLILAEGLGPQASVQHLLGEIRQINSGKNLSSESEAENQKHSRSALSLLNVTEISKKALGKYWAKRSDSEQKKFATLLGELFIHVAFPSSAKFFAELNIIYGKIKEEKPKVVVPLTVVHEKEGEVGIDFHLIQTEGKWQVVDVILDGVSMRNNLRSQFYKVISRKDFNKLTHRMEKKLEDAKR